MSDYKSYLLRQLGIKESQYKSFVNDPYDDIDPDELRKGADDETGEHGMSPEDAERTAMDHLTAPDQGHYYTGVETAKDAGMLKERRPFDSISPTAKSPAILAIGIRGTPGGIMPTSLAPSDTAIAPEGAGVDAKSKAALGGLELVSRQTPNSTIVNKTPQNDMINSESPISDIVPTTPADEHPSQVQNIDGVSVQALAGSTDDGDAPMGDKPEPEEFEVGEEGEEDMSLTGACPKGLDIDVPRDEGEEEEEEEDETSHMLKEGKHKAGCQCGFCKNKGSFGKKKEDDKTNVDEKPEKLTETKCRIKGCSGKAVNGAREKHGEGFQGLCNNHIESQSEREKKTGDHSRTINWIMNKSVDETFARHKKLMQEKLGIEESSTEECKDCGCDKLNTVHSKKTKKLTTERLKVLKEHFTKKLQKSPLTEQEIEASNRIDSILKSREV
jgi:hypothetical protein